MERSRLLVTVPAEQGLRQSTGSLIMTLGRNIMQNNEKSPSEYSPQENSTGCQIAFAILLFILAALSAFVGIFFIRLASSPIGSGSGGFIVIGAFLLAGASGIGGLIILLSALPRK